MGKNLLSSELSTVQIQDNNPGCMWGILHILDYHHWHVKKVFSHKKRRHDRHKRKAVLHNQGEDQQDGIADAKSLLVRQHNKRLSAKGKSSPKNRKKGPHTENRFKEESSECWISSLPGESQHLESSDEFVRCKPCDTMDYSGQNQASGEHALRPEKDGKTTETALNQKRMETNKLNRDISNKFKKHTDVLEAFRMEKDLLLKFLRDLNVGGKIFHQASHNKARLTKSGSFPLTTPSRMKNISTSTFKHKQYEIWAFPKGQKLLAGTQAPELSASSFVNDISYEKPMPSVGDLDVDGAMKQKPGSSSRSTQGLNHKGWNQLVLHQFKVIKQKIKHALVELKKSGNQTSHQAINLRTSPEYSITNNEKEVSQSLDDGVIQEYRTSKSSNETKASDHVSNKHEARLMRRTSSLNESLDRYTQLFEKSFSKDVKWNSSKSKSLKLTSEDKIHKSGHASKFSRSNLSLPSLESLGFILHEALFDTNDIVNTVETDNHVQRKSVSLPLKHDKSLDRFLETEVAESAEGGGRDVNPSPLSREIVEKIDGLTSEYREDIHESAVGDGSFPQEKVEISVTTNPSKEVMAALETIYEDNATNHAEGRELNTQGSSMDELENDLPSRGSVYSLPGSLSDTNANVTAKGTNKSHDNHFLLFKSDTENNSNFKYVKAVLEFSGFMGHEQILIRHTVDQPLKPLVLKDLDASLSHELESSVDETNNSYDRQLLFNVVNEVVLEIFERSPTYFPRPFSFNYRLHPLPKGQYLLNEVWSSVNSYLSLRPELDQTLEDVVGRDLAKSSGWMKLQQEEECVALELEEMIVDDLLDEIIFS